MLLTDEQRMVRDTVRDFAASELAPGAAERDRASCFPRDQLARMGELGLLGMLVEPRWGGSGADQVSYALAIEEVAAADAAVSTIMAVHNSVGCVPIARFGSAAQKRRWLGALARGELLAAFALTEPQAGSDASNLRSRARRDGVGWVLDGVKQFITSGRHADLVNAFVVTDAQAGKHGITAFVVPSATPGYRVARLEDKLGQRASDTAQIVFEDLHLDDGHRLGAEGEGYRIALSNLEGGRIGIGAQCVGMARAAFDAARRYAREREAFGKPIAEHQAVAFRLADMASSIECARQMVLHAAALRDAGQPCLAEAAMAKLVASELAERVCSAALQTFGGYGYLNDFPVERIWRDVRVAQIYEGTSDVQRLIIARAVAAMD